MALAVPPKPAAYQLLWREGEAVGGRGLQGGEDAGRKRVENKKRKRTKKKETLIGLKEKGGNCTLPSHALRQRSNQAAHLFMCC